MTDDDYRMLLHRFDDPVYGERPANFNYHDAAVRFKSFYTALEETLGQTVQIDLDTQDACFHSQIIFPEVQVRFSKFGNMVAISDESELDSQTLTAIKSIAYQQGYLYIPERLVWEDYDGQNPGVTGIPDWWTRFFDYL